jgi:Asp-tRNA(Asn)/Glu-tRNA(Gln) amidotransferase A subunit family amidase
MQRLPIRTPELPSRNHPPPMTSPENIASNGLDRRSFMSYFAGIGLGSTLLPGVLWAQVAQGADITAATVACAEEIAGLSFDDEQRAAIAQGLRSQQNAITALRRIEIPNSVSPAILFNPLPAGMTLRPRTATAMIRSAPTLRSAPSSEEELAFLPVSELSELVRRREVSSLRLTEMYIARLKRYDPILKCVVNLTEERALAQARAADAEIGRGIYRGPLHGIPWGAKDLLAVRGTPTTWGTAPYQDQMLDEDATVVQRLDAAGAVLVAKLTLGELAQGDLWFGGRTNNPWNIQQGSSGSSAGPGSATAAGLVAFAIGSETLGSISSPATRNGVTGLRPTFGRVPKTGAMALSWSMDKLGPMCRSAEDCALVLDAIHGADGRDHSARDADFTWDATLRPAALRIGYIRSSFEREATTDAARAGLARDVAVLDVLRAQGATLMPVDLPEVDTNAMRFILTAEAAAAFDDLTRSGRDALMTPQSTWPRTFRTARFYTAVDYINANRARTLAIEEWAKLMRTVDVIVTPTGGGNQLTATNLTGHPAVILPHGFTDAGTPVSITFLGQLFEEAKLLAVANAYQRATEFHSRRPRLDG